MKKLLLFSIFIVLLMVNASFASDVLVGTFEVGSILPELNMMLKGYTGTVLYLYDPLDTTSPDGFLVVHGKLNKYVLSQDGIVYIFVPNDAGNTITLYRRGL